MHLRLLLITTSPNAVERTINSFEEINLYTIDCKDYFDDDVRKMKSTLLSAIDFYYREVATPDMIITYRCPIIIPQRIYSRVKFGAFNIHPSLLPKYPGLNPWKDIYRNQEKESGVTLHQMDEHADSGTIISQKSFMIAPDDTLENARSKADMTAASIVGEFLSYLMMSL